MARPISFDPENALRRAMDLFWTRGYRAVSVDDLVHGSGLNRHSLYGRFRNKYGLLLATLERYRDDCVQGLEATLAQPGTPREKLERLFSLRAPDCADPFWRSMLTRGCFGFRMAAELRDRHPEVLALAQEIPLSLQDTLIDLIREGQAAGEFRSDRPPEVLASIVTDSFVAPLIVPANEQRVGAVLSALN
ncbi:MAG: TetR/AcrR family transcriptional regulator [Planctomycetota bacterium]